MHGVQVAVHLASSLLDAQVLSGHRWKVASQARAHASGLPVQVSEPLGSAAGHVAHDAPQAATVLLGTQVGAAGVPRLQKPGRSHKTSHTCVVAGRGGAMQAAMPSAAGVGTGHAVHDAPQVAVALLLTHGPVSAGQRWKLGRQAKPHTLLVHTASAFGSDEAAQGVHAAAVPHCVMLSLGKHPVIRGQVCVPAPHTIPQTAFVQAEPTGQGSQSRPSLVPHVRLALLLTHRPPQRWKPALHAGTQLPRALHVTLPLAGAVHTVQVLPHELIFVLPLTTHELPLQA